MMKLHFLLHMQISEKDFFWGYHKFLLCHSSAGDWEWNAPSAHRKLLQRKTGSWQARLMSTVLKISKFLGASPHSCDPSNSSEPFRKRVISSPSPRKPQVLSVGGFAEDKCTWTFFACARLTGSNFTEAEQSQEKNYKKIESFEEI